MFHCFCEEQGYTVNCLRKAVPVVGQEQQSICSYTTFKQFWKKHFPLLLLRRPTEDLCNKCYVFANKFRYNLSQDEESSDDDDDDSEGGERVGHTELLNIDEEDADIPPNIAVVLSKSQQERAKMVEEAHQHVKDADTMREAAQAATEKAQQSFKKFEAGEIPYSERVDCIVCDFCQNLGLPFYGNQQPGVTYYLSQLVIPCFGLADVGKTGAQKLKAYIYHEGQAAKGGNVVASLLFKYLTEQFFDKDKGPRKEITIIMDNCAGQNKNRMVLRLIILLVELGYYKRVNCLFLVVGHTKNACDRFFNLLKLKYRQSNVYSMDDLLKVLSTCEAIEPEALAEGDIKDFDSFERKIYKVTLQGSSKFQFFYSKDDEKGILFCAETTASEATPWKAGKKMNSPERAQLLQEFPSPSVIPVVPAPGITPQKQVEMHKFHKYIPPEYQNDPLYQHPPDEVIANIKKHQKDWKCLRVEQKEGAATALKPSKNIAGYTMTS